MNLLIMSTINKLVAIRLAVTNGSQYDNPIEYCDNDITVFIKNGGEKLKIIALLNLVIDEFGEFIHSDIIGPGASFEMSAGEGYSVTVLLNSLEIKANAFS